MSGRPHFSPGKIELGFLARSLFEKKGEVFLKRKQFLVAKIVVVFK